MAVAAAEPRKKDAKRDTRAPLLLVHTQSYSPSDNTRASYVTFAERELQFRGNDRHPL